LRKAIFVIAVLAFCFFVSGQASGFYPNYATVWGGYVSPEDPIENTYGFGCEVGLVNPMPNLWCSLETTYWNKSWNDPTFTGLKYSWTDISIGTTAKYHFAVPSSPVLPYAGIGGGCHFLSFKLELGTISTSVSDTKFGIHCCGGVQVPFSPLVKGIVEARYNWVNPDYLCANVGVCYNFGR
jgi:opacity protein-like surface antigen